MKNLMVIIVVLLFSACSSDQLEIGKAKKCAEGFLNTLKVNNFDEAEKYYSTDEFYSEATQTRSEKIEELATSIGKVISYSLTDSAFVELKGEPSAIYLTYKVENEKINSTQIFIIQKEGSEYKIISQDVKAGE
jgi:hypothetical protein